LSQSFAKGSQFNPAAAVTLNQAFGKCKIDSLDKKWFKPNYESVWWQTRFGNSEQVNATFGRSEPPTEHVKLCQACPSAATTSFKQKDN